jgi:DNA-binding transcriptional ArsR family regulator
MVARPPDDELDLVFHALADATRRDILRRTLAEELSISGLASDYAMSFAAVQKHVRVLQAARLVNKTAAGRQRLVRADPERLRRARELLVQLERLWRDRLTRLDDLLTEAKE